MKIYRYLILVFSFFLFSQAAYAETTQETKPVQILPRYVMTDHDQKINNYYRTPESKNKDITQRVVAASQYFLGQPYLLGALGEGIEARFDKHPLYRTDAFDCTTFVSTVLALAESNNLKQFRNNIIKVNYKNGEVSYVNRAHFMSVGWNPNNIQNGYLVDITSKFINQTGQPIAAIAHTVIDKPAWFKKRSAADIFLFQPVSQSVLTELLNAMHELANQVGPEKSAMPYLPLNQLFDAQGNPNMFLFDQIPTGAVIEIIRPNWDLTAAIGTHLNVSHMGFAVRSKDNLMYRNASSVKHQVADVPLIDYLHGYLQSPTVKGISVFKVVPSTTKKA